MPEVGWNRCADAAAWTVFEDIEVAAAPEFFCSLRLFDLLPRSGDTIVGWNGTSSFCWLADFLSSRS